MEKNMFNLFWSPESPRSRCQQIQSLQGAHFSFQVLLSISLNSPFMTVAFPLRLFLACTWKLLQLLLQLSSGRLIPQFTSLQKFLRCFWNRVQTLRLALNVFITLTTASPGFLSFLILCIPSPWHEHISWTGIIFFLWFFQCGSQGMGELPTNS